MNLKVKVSGTLVGEEKISYNLQIDSNLICTGIVLVKEKVGEIIKTYFEKSIGKKAQKLVDISFTQDTTFFTWKTFAQLNPSRETLLPTAK